MKFLTCVVLALMLCLLFACPLSAQQAATYFERGEQFSENGQWDKAIGEYQHAAHINPNYVDAYLGMAHAYNNEKKYSEAAGAAKEAAHLSPQSMLAHYNMGVAFYKLEKWNDAQAAFDEAHRLQPDTAEANIGVGLMHLHFNRTQEAIKAFKAALDIQPDSAVSHLGLGMADVLIGDRMGATSEYQILQSLSPSMAPQLQQALEQLNKTEAASQNDSAANSRGESAAKAQSMKWPAGLSYLLGLLPLALLAGLFIYNRNRSTLEVPVREKTEIRDPNSLIDNELLPVPFPRINRATPEILPAIGPGGVSALTPRLRTAQPTILLDTPSNITSANAQFRIANAHYKAGKYQEALEAFQDALRLNHNHMEALNGLGQTYAQLECWHEALETYKQVIRINPENALGHINLGDTYLALEQPQVALEAYKQAIRLTPHDPRAHYQYAVACIALNDKGTALDEFKILKKSSAEMANKLFNVIYPS